MLLSNEALLFKNFNRHLNDSFFSLLKIFISLLSIDIDDFNLLSEWVESIKILIISAFSLSNSLKLFSLSNNFLKTRIANIKR